MKFWFLALSLLGHHTGGHRRGRQDPSNARGPLEVGASRVQSLRNYLSAVLTSLTRLTGY